MNNERRIVKWTGVGLIIAGAAIAVTPLFFGYAPIAAPAWWGLYFSVFWGGIAAAVVGAAALLTGQYYMKRELPPHEPRREMEIPA